MESLIVFFILLGLWMIYTTSHLMVIQIKKDWSKRTTYEKVVTVSGMVSIAIVFLSVMFGE